MKQKKFRLSEGKVYGFFSPSQAASGGTVFYFDLEGNEIEVSEVGHGRKYREETSKRLKDGKFMGVLDRYSRQGRNRQWGFSNPFFPLSKPLIIHNKKEN